MSERVLRLSVATTYGDYVALYRTPYRGKHRYHINYECEDGRVATILVGEKLLRKMLRETRRIARLGYEYESQIGGKSR